MKKVLLICVLLCLSTTISATLHIFSTETVGIEDTGEALVKRVGLVYEFPHSMDYFPEIEDRFVRWINREKLLVSSVSLVNNRCQLTFVEGVSDSDVTESLKFATAACGYTSFKIDSL